MTQFIGNFTEAMKDYTEKKLEKLNEKGIEIKDIRVKLNMLPIGMNLEISINNKIRQSKTSEKDFYSLVCEVIDNLAIQIERYKSYEKKKEDGFLLKTEPGYKISRKKILIVPSISQEEAIENMEALGHSFFIYRDIDLADDIVVLYKREDGSYGSIQCR